MTNEQLLIPRFKVIGTYPNSMFEIGDIITKTNEVENHFRSSTGEDVFCPEEHPQIFQKLEWWQELKRKNFPKYISVNGEIISTEDIISQLYSNISFKDMDMSFKSVAKRGIRIIVLRNSLPATKKDFDNFINK